MTPVHVDLWAPLAVIAAHALALPLGDRRLAPWYALAAAGAAWGSPAGLWATVAVSGAALSRPADAADPWRRALVGAVGGLLGLGLGARVAATMPPGPVAVAGLAVTSLAVAGAVATWLRVDPDGPSAAAAINLTADDARPVEEAASLYREARPLAPWRLRAHLAGLTAAVVAASHQAHRLRALVARTTAPGDRAGRVRAALADTIAHRQRLLDTLAEAHAALHVAHATSTDVDEEVRRRVLDASRQAWARRDATLEVAPLTP